ncbi:TPR-like protein [Mycena sanguinolenta]|uniref:TPR-like protein n=1 Tax=Mycena sanguinolenta TaxID=230812 RepID=A0A8H6XMK5_9AGAR|nr:TPR-like protein [Mycena sanguinolenta]
MSMSRAVSSLAYILGEAQTSTLRTFSLFLKSFGTFTSRNEPPLDLHIPLPHPYLTNEIRQEEMASLLEELANPTRSCIACTGGYGMGKSALALLAVHDLSAMAAFERRRWINCHALTDTSHFLQVLAAQMGVPAADFSPSACRTRLETIVAAIQRLYPAGRTLIVLDDLDHLYFLDKSFTDAAIEALAKIQGLTLLLTVNGWAATPPPVVEWSLDLKALTQEKAEYLFHSIYPVPFQRKELSELLKLVGTVPQHVVVLAILAYEKRLKLVDLLQIIDDPEKNLLGFKMEGHKSLEASIQAYTPEDRLGRDPHALRVFHVLASLPGGLPRDRLSSYVGLPPVAIDSICDQLANLSLIRTDHPGHLMLTKPARDYALRFSEFDEQTRQLLLSELISLAEIPKNKLRPGTPEFLETVRQFEHDKTSLESILFSFLDQHLPIAVEAALRYLAPRCAVRPSLKLATKAVEVAQKISDQRLIAHTLQTLGEVNFNIGMFDAEAVLGRAEVLFNSCEDEDSVIHGLECRFLMSEIWMRSGHYPTDKYAPAFADAVQLSSTLSSEAGRRCHAHGLLRQASLTTDERRSQKLFQTAQAIFQDLEDDYGVALCALRLGKLPLADAATKFQEWGDLEASARCYHSVVSSTVEYIKVNNLRKTYLERKGGSANSKVLESLRKAIDIYKLLGRNLDAAFCQYHLAQHLPPAEAVTLYSPAIHVFHTSAFTHHRERATLDMCYSLVEGKHYSEAITELEVLQNKIGYCGQIFVVRSRELLAECHCRLNATHSALQAVRGVLDALAQLDSEWLNEIELLTPTYTNLLAMLEGPSNIPPATAFETHAQGAHRFIQLDDEQSQPE